jgi:hypothetical protein
VLSSDEEAFGGYQNATKNGDIEFRADMGNFDNRPHSMKARCCIAGLLKGRVLKVATCCPVSVCCPMSLFYDLADCRLLQLGCILQGCSFTSASEAFSLKTVLC